MILKAMVCETSARWSKYTTAIFGIKSEFTSHRVVTIFLANFAHKLKKAKMQNTN